MIRIRSLIIILILYLIGYFSIIYNINILYPYYYLKDMVLYPVRALESKEITLSDTQNNTLLEAKNNDIEELKKLLKIQNITSDFNYLNATVIERNREYWFNTMTINKGSKDGLTIDMAVINGDGLIGRISALRDYTADIKLITTNDVTNKISVLIQNNEKNVYGIMSGYDIENNLLKVIVQDNKIQPNDLVTTTGMGGIFPSGILIGKVIDIITENDEVTKVARVKPSAIIEGVKYVSVLQRKTILDN